MIRRLRTVLSKLVFAVFRFDKLIRKEAGCVDKKKSAALSLPDSDRFHFPSAVDISHSPDISVPCRLNCTRRQQQMKKVVSI